MDFKIETKSGIPQMTFEKDYSIRNNIFLSLTLARGAFFQDPTFGHRLNEVKKNTVNAPALVKEYAREALQWVIDTGRAKSITIETERGEKDRINISVSAVEADGNEVKFETFYEVV